MSQKLRSEALIDPDAISEAVGVVVVDPKEDLDQEAVINAGIDEKSCEICKDAAALEDATLDKSVENEIAPGLFEDVLRSMTPQERTAYDKAMISQIGKMKSEAQGLLSQELRRFVETVG